MTGFFQLGQLVRTPVVIALALLNSATCFAQVQSVRNALPAIFEYQQKGKRIAVPSNELFVFEHAVRQRFTDKVPPNEMYVLAWSSSADFLLSKPASVDHPRGMLLIEIRNGRGTLRASTEFGEKQSQRALSDGELMKLRGAIKFEKLSRLDGVRTVRGKQLQVVGGTIYLYLHVTPENGSRVWISNPPNEGDKNYPPHDPHWDYSRLVNLFLDLDTEAASE